MMLLSVCCRHLWLLQEGCSLLSPIQPTPGQPSSSGSPKMRQVLGAAEAASRPGAEAVNAELERRPGVQNCSSYVAGAAQVYLTSPLRDRSQLSAWWHRRRSRPAENTR